MRTQIAIIHSLVLSMLMTVAILLGGILGPYAATAATYYVATTGSDSNSCTQASPCATINKVGGMLVAGDTLYLRAGTYAQYVYSWKLASGGTSWAAPVTIAAYPGETVTLRPPATTDLTLDHVIFFYGSAVKPYVIFDHLIIDGSLLAEGDAVKFDPPHHHIRVQNSEIKNAPSCGFLVSTNDNEFLNLDVHDNGKKITAYGFYIIGHRNVIDHNRVYSNSGYGIHVYDRVKKPSNNIVKNSQIYNNVTTTDSTKQTQAGLLFASGDSNLAYNNLLWGNRYGISIGDGASNSKVYNNTIYGTTYNSIHNGNYGATNTVIKNNILIAPAGGWGVWDEGTGTIFAANICSMSGPDCTSVGDPKFVNAATSDLRLQSTSPAINAGTTLPEVTVDFDNVGRPQGTAYDIGAFEYPVTSSALVSPTSLQLSPQ